MRENKFRAWVKELGTLANVVAINFEIGKVVLDIETEGTYWWHTSTFDLKDVVLMQYTGLKDKNDVEIYDGDIVAIDFMDMDSQLKKGVVTFIECGYYVDTGNSLIPLFGEIETKEVLDNIYESPELLKGGE
ncbi:MAG TPA: YopX family protein [Metalysinibacillus sp.]